MSVHPLAQTLEEGVVFPQNKAARIGFTKPASAAFILSLAVGPLAGKMLGSMFWFFEYRFTILPVLLTIPVFLLLGWLIAN